LTNFRTGVWDIRRICAGKFLSNRLIDESPNLGINFAFLDVANRQKVNMYPDAIVLDKPSIDHDEAPQESCLAATDATGQYIGARVGADDVLFQSMPESAVPA